MFADMFNVLVQVVYKNKSKVKKTNIVLILSWSEETPFTVRSNFLS